jgi:hypothetical protein
MAQWEEYLPSKCEALSSTRSEAKKKEKNSIEEIKLGII